MPRRPNLNPWTGATVALMGFANLTSPRTSANWPLDSVKYEGTPYFPVTASSAKIGLLKSI